MVFVLLVVVSPAVQRHDATGVERIGTEVVYGVDASLASLSAVAERVPVPSVWPMQAVTVDGVAGVVAASSLLLVLAAALALGRVGLTRRDRAPPRHLPVLA
jgi:hypothetical protein